MHACKLTLTQNMMTLSGYSPLFPLSLSLCLCRANCAVHKGWQKRTATGLAFFTLQVGVSMVNRLTD